MAREVEDDEDDYQTRAKVYMKEKAQKSSFTMPEGDTTFRILKTPRDESRNSPSVWTEYYIHRNVGPKKWRKPCGVDALTDEGDCWLCKKVASLRAKEETKQAADLERQKTFAVQLAIWEPDLRKFRGPVLWEMRSGKSKKAVSFSVQRIVGGGKKEYLNHKTGFNYTVNRTGLGKLDTVYGPMERDDQPSAVPESILAKLKPFADVIAPYDAEDQKKTYYGQKDDDEGESVQSKKRPSRFEDDEEEVKPKKRRPVDEDEDDAPPPKKRRPTEDDDSEEEDDAPPPKKKKPAPVDEDEAEDLNYGDDEDEAPPKKKKPAPVEDEPEEDDDAPPPKKKKPAPVEDDEDEDAPPPKKKASRFDDDEDDAPPPKKRKPEPVEEEEEDAPPPKKWRPADDDDDDAPPPKKRPIPDDEDEVEAPPKKHRPADDDEEEDAPPPKKRRPTSDDQDEEDEDPRPKKRR